MDRIQNPASRSLKARLAVRRLAGLLRRLWPLWLAWVVVWTIAPTRDWARLVIWGSPLRQWNDVSLREIWDEVLSPWNSRVQPPKNPLPAAIARPNDLDLALWQWVYRAGWENQPLSQLQLAQVEAHHANEPVVMAVSVQKYMGIGFWNGYYRYRSAPALPPGGLLVQMRRGQAQEPSNAFWYVAQALWHWRAQDHDATLRNLERAARCTRYDDKTLEVVRRALTAGQRYGAFSVEERSGIAQRALFPQNEFFSDNGRVWAEHALRLDASAPLLSLRWSAALAAIGDLMMRPPNGRSAALTGKSWQKFAWQMQSKSLKANRLKRLSAVAPKGNEPFAHYALALNRPDIARATRVQTSYARSLSAQLNRADRYGNVDNSLYLGRGPLGLGTRAQWLEGATFVGVVGLCAGIYFALWWGAANLLLWRARAAPSSRRARVVAPVVVLTFCLALALCATVLGLNFPTTPGPAPLVESAVIALAIPAFFGAPFGLALWCAIATLRRERVAFALPPRVETEMRLSPALRALLRWFLPASFACCVALTLGGLALWLVANWQGWGNVDVLALLPPDRKGQTGSLFWDMAGAPIPLVYGIFLCVMCLPIWFWRWRWAGAPALRPVTQSGLRWWKETLSGLVVAMSWLFLLLALALWPLRAQANAELNQILRVGEIARLPLTSGAFATKTLD